MPKRKREEKKKSKEERKKVKKAKKEKKQLKKEKKKKKEKRKKDKSPKHEVEVPDETEPLEQSKIQDESVKQEEDTKTIQVQQEEVEEGAEVSKDHEVQVKQDDASSSSEESSVIISPSRSKTNPSAAAVQDSSDDEENLRIFSKRTGTTPLKHDSQKDAEIQDTDSSDGEKEGTRTTRNTRLRSSRSTIASSKLNESPPTRRNLKASLGDSSSDSGGDHDNDSVCTPRNQNQSDGDDQQIESIVRKSPRKSISSAIDKISAIAKDNNEDIEYSDQDDDSAIKTFKATKKQKEEDEDSYRNDENEASDGSDEFDEKERDIFHDDMSFDNDESSEEEDGVGHRAKGTPTRNINNDDIFDQADDAFVSPTKKVELTPLKLKKRGQFKYESEGDDDDEVEIISTPMAERQDQEMAAMPLCSSEFDEITMQSLPKLHVCYLAPDKKTRHCFCLQTLYKASILSGKKIRKSDGGLRFLQPPHFRTAMSDDLIDQIAARFGRQALIIEDSTVYKKDRNGLQIPFDHTGFDVDAVEESFQDRIDESFQDRFNNYLNEQMGSNDIYCCPLCYCEAQRRFRGGDEEDDENSDVEEDEYEYSMENVTNYSKVDPMSILGSPDSDCFEVAASFCFKKMAQVKRHIRLVHKIDVSEVEANDFLKRFMIRTQDGLLQRFVRAFWKHQVLEGAMRKYWHEGHNQSYILLRILIERQQYMQEYNPECVDNAFSGSFPQRAVKIWQNLSAPYSKSDASDFIESGEEEIVEEVHPVFERPENIEDDLVQHLRTRREIARSRKHGYDSSSDSSSSESQDEDIDQEDEEDEIIDINDEDDGDVYIEESSEDEWVARKRTMGRRKKFPTRLKTKKAGLGSDDESSLEFARPTGSRKVNNLDSSDESDDNSASSGKQKTPIKKVHILESDEE